MRWKPAKDKQLENLAGLPMHILARQIGTTEGGVEQHARVLGISLDPKDGNAEGCRQRWKLRMPEMKEALRRDLLRLGLIEKR